MHTEEKFEAFCRARAAGVTVRAAAPPNLPLLPDGTHLFRAWQPNELWATDITEFGLPWGADDFLDRAQAR